MRLCGAGRAGAARRARAPRRLAEHRSLEHLGAQSAAPHSGEYELVWVATRDVRGKFLDEEAGNRYLAALVAFRRTPGLYTAH